MAQSSWTTIVSRIRAQMEAVTSIGLVHDELKLATTEEEINSIAKVTADGEDRLRVWMIHLEDMPSAWADQSGNEEWRRGVVIEGFLQFEPGVEKTALGLAEAVIRKLDTDVRVTKLNGAVLAGGPCSLAANEARILGFVLMQYVRIHLPVTTIEI